jgi:hypothetical protein
MVGEKIASALALALTMIALSGCNGSGTGITLPNILSPNSPPITLTGNPLTDFAPITSKIATMTVADVDAALADAQSQTPVDGVGVACWSAVKTALPALATNRTVGIASALQHGRDLQSLGPVLLKQCATIVPFLGSPIP